jgi:hypothetical protein
MSMAKWNALTVAKRLPQKGARQNNSCFAPVRLLIPEAFGKVGWRGALKAQLSSRP